MSKRGNGEGTISKRKNGTWCAAITAGINPDTGKPKRVFYYGKTRQEVAEKLNKAINTISTGTFIEPSRIAFYDWLNTWLNEYKKSNIRPATYEIYLSIIELHIKPTIGHMLLKDLRPEHLQNLYNTKYDTGKGLSASSIRRMHNMIHDALGQALMTNLVFRNVTEATTLPKLTKKPIKVMSKDEQLSFLAALSDDRLRALFILALASGMREGELLALSKDDLQLDEGVLYVRRSLRRVNVEGEATKTRLIFQDPKTESGKRVIPLPDSVISELKSHLIKQAEEKLSVGEVYTEHNLVFCTELGMPIDPRNLRKRYKTLLKKSKIQDIPFHALRHTYATRLLEANEHPKVVQEILGHSDIAMTLNIYSHVMPEVKKAAAQKIDFLFESI